MLIVCYMLAHGVGVIILLTYPYHNNTGKSSLMLALFRIVEPEAGSVLEIDGINVLAMGLEV